MYVPSVTMTTLYMVLIRRVAFLKILHKHCCSCCCQSCTYTWTPSVVVTTKYCREPCIYFFLLAAIMCNITAKCRQHDQILITWSSYRNLTPKPSQFFDTTKHFAQRHGRTEVRYPGLHEFGKRLVRHMIKMSRMSKWPLPGRSQRPLTVSIRVKHQ